MANRGEMRRCPHCGLVYRHFEGGADWCRVCQQGLRHQPPEIRRLVRLADEDFDRGEREYLDQP